MRIKLSAYLKICCHCGEHGKIYFADGQSTINLCSKELALLALKQAEIRGMVTPEELVAVEFQIASSPLPCYQPDVPLFVNIAADILDAFEDGREEESFQHCPSRTVH